MNEHVLDLRGQLCPAPVIALGRAARDAPGTRVVLLSDDPAARSDIPAWCSLTGGGLIDVTELDRWHVYVVDLPSRGGAVTSAGNAAS